MANLFLYKGQCQEVAWSVYGLTFFNLTQKRATATLTGHAEMDGGGGGGAANMLRLNVKFNGS
jgi:hypothetical protein